MTGSGDAEHDGIEIKIGDEWMTVTDHDSNRRLSVSRDEETDEFVLWAGPINGFQIISEVDRVATNGQALSAALEWLAVDRS